MSLLSLASMLEVAGRNKFAVGAFNGVDSHYIDAIFQAAGELRAPIIINIAEVHFKFLDVEAIAAYTKNKAAASNLPISLNLDHGVTFGAIQRAVAAGFTSVMFDGSHLSYDDNIQSTKAVVELCHRHGISVEGELGAVGGDEGGNLEGSANEMMFTDPLQATDYVNKTRIDALAVAIGNSHGKYKGKPKLDFGRLSALGEAVDIPLVLHGGSGLSTDDFRKAIGLGITKLNFFTGMSQAAIAAISGGLANEEFSNKYDRYSLIMQNAEREIYASVKEQIEIFGSEDKARYYA